MRRTKPTFGHVKMNYGLDHIVKHTAGEFAKADAAAEQSRKEFEAGKGQNDSESIKRMEQVFSTSQRRVQLGVVLLLSATAYLEQVINDYAHTFLDPDAYDEHLDNLRQITKWILLPRLCQIKNPTEEDPAINALRELLKARNAVAHHRRKEMYLDVAKAAKNVSSESDRFLFACRKASSTVDALLKILTSPPPALKTQNAAPSEDTPSA